MDSRNPFTTLSLTPAWVEAYPGSMIGLLAVAGAGDPPHTTALEARRSALERDLRDRFSGKSRSDILALPVIQAYRAYYRRFQKTYHVQLQLESVALKAKPIAGMPGLVEAAFLAELETQLLTAVHDLDRVEPPLTVDIARGEEVYTLLRGEDHACARGDMIMRDSHGVICSVIYGSDLRTKITRDTRDVLFATYVPPGIPASLVEHHQRVLEGNMRAFSPASRVLLNAVYNARRP